MNNKAKKQVSVDELAQAIMAKIVGWKNISAVPPCPPFRYLVLLFVAGDGAYAYAPFSTDTPVSVGHEIDWAWNPNNPDEEMHLEVTGICHRQGQTTLLFCEYDDHFDDSYLVDICVKLGMKKEYADKKPQAVREMRADGLVGECK